MTRGEVYMPISYHTRCLFGYDRTANVIISRTIRANILEKEREKGNGTIG